MNIGLMLFGMKDVFKQILTKMASDYIGPAGAIPFERLVARHLGAFQELRERGLTWEQISRLLFGAGILRGDGRSFPPSHLRGVYGRQQNRLLKKEQHGPARKVRKPAGIDVVCPAVATASGCVGRRGMATGEATVSVTDRLAKVPASNENGDSSSGPAPVNAHDGQQTDFSPVKPAAGRDRALVLSLMRQSAQARRSD